MKRFIFLSTIAIFAIFIASCSKPESSISSNSETTHSSGDNTTYQTPTVCCNNISENPYNVYIDGYFEAVISGKSSKTFLVSTGYHKIRVLQKSGYIFYPTDETYTFTAVSGGSYYVYFPEDDFGK